MRGAIAMVAAPPENEEAPRRSQPSRGDLFSPGVESSEGRGDLRSKIWIKPYGFIVIGDGADAVTLGLVREAADDVGIGILRIEPDGLAVVRDRALVVALGSVRVAAVEEGRGILRIEPDRLAVVRDGAVVVALVFVRVAAGEEGPVA